VVAGFESVNGAMLYFHTLLKRAIPKVINNLFTIYSKTDLAAKRLNYNG
jgi:hypothetical protein